ncbi:MAG TPA: hypothetical protein VKP30_25190 [Polyangiaceae bacterium]|nr:hypothetical protein [Polyangiaceae bacterium]
MCLLALLALSGCFRTSIRSGKAPGLAPTAWEERWNHGLFWGQIDSHGPAVANQICPAGWAEIDTSLDPMQTVIAVATLGIYTPTTVSVVCADPRFDSASEQ